jgi:hypothetical protein
MTKWYFKVFFGKCVMDRNEPAQFQSKQFRLGAWVSKYLKIKIP